MSKRIGDVFASSFCSCFKKIDHSTNGAQTKHIRRNLVLREAKRCNQKSFANKTIFFLHQQKRTKTLFFRVALGLSCMHDNRFRGK